MVDWGTSSFQIITGVIGSGVLLFILNTANTDFNQPHIRIEGSNPSENQSRTVVANDGRSAATNVRLTLIFFDNDGQTTNTITDFARLTKTENFTLIQEDQRTLIGNVPRLTRGAWISILTNTSRPATYVASATYDQGTIVGASEKITSAQKDNPFFVISRDFIPFSSQIIMILLVISTIFLLVSLLLYLYKRIRRLMTDDISEFISKVKNEIVNIRDTLQNDIQSKSIFSSELWTSADNNYKSKIFDNYDDYRRLDAFYTELKQRHEKLLNNPATTEALLRYNREIALQF
jgi:hypothetical protein